MLPQRKKLNQLRPLVVLARVNALVITTVNLDATAADMVSVSLVADATHAVTIAAMAINGPMTLSSGKQRTTLHSTESMIIHTRTT